LIALVAAALCVLANGFFVAAEFAFAKVRPTSLDALARAGDKKAELAFEMTRRLDAYLSATQLGITLASLGLGWLGEPALAGLIEAPLRSVGASAAVIHGIAFGVAFAIISLLHIVLGELVPKSIAINYPEKVSRISGRALRVFFVITWPAMWILNELSTAVLRLLRLPPMQHAEGKLSAEEIRLIIQASFTEEGERDRKRDLLERVLRGTDRHVRVVMVPRVDMVVLSTDDDVDSCIGLVRKHGYSRYPLCEGGDPDKVLGYVHVKDLLRSAGEPANALVDKKRDVLFVPETAKVGDLLSEFQLTSTPIAIVVDEYGGTDGLVTVEDVVEEMVGEIQDEHDLERPRVVEREDGVISVDASVVLSELGLEGLDVDEDLAQESVGAFVVDRLGRLAEPGDRIRCGRYDAVVEIARRRRVRRVAFVPRPVSVVPDEPVSD
jgi:CBS domain containing-hemolysin-like protein